MEIKSQYRNEDLGVEAWVLPFSNGFEIKLVDLDAMEVINSDTHIIYPTFEGADEYARRCVADF